MDYLKCLGVAVFLTFAGGLAWIIREIISINASLPAGSNGVSYDLRSLFDERFLLAIIISFIAGFFIEFMILKRGLLRSRQIENRGN